MSTAKTPQCMGLDFGGGGIKAVIIYPDGSTERVKDPRGAEVIRTALYRGKDGKLLFGDDAIDQGFIDPANLATDFKRYFGVPDKKYFGGTASAEDVAAMLIQCIKELAETQTGQTVSNLCYTAPANFPDYAKMALQRAVTRAGFTPIEDGSDGSALIFEPAGAALAYGLEHGLEHQNVNILVVDIGSTTTDITQMEFTPGQARVLNNQGITVGGSNFLRILTEIATEKAAKAGLPVGPDAQDPVQRHDTEMAAERSKIALSKLEKTLISMQAGNKRKTVEVTQREYHERITPSLEQIAAAADKGLSESNRTIKDFQLVVLVGGPTRDPYVQQFFEKHFGTKPRVDIDPLSAIVNGAAKHGLWLLQRRQTGNRAIGIDLKECVPHHIGVLVYVGDGVNHRTEATILIKKGLPVPAKVTRSFYLAFPHVGKCDVAIVQCDREGAPPEECYTLGSAVLKDLPIEVVRTERIEITAEFSASSIATVTAKDKVSGKCLPVKMTNETGLRPRAA
ncbi:MAG: Hsp70 family protein [Phycisphaerae bacterium]